MHCMRSSESTVQSCAFGHCAVPVHITTQHSKNAAQDASVTWMMVWVVEESRPVEISSPNMAMMGPTAISAVVTRLRCEANHKMAWGTDTKVVWHCARHAVVAYAWDNGIGITRGR